MFTLGLNPLVRFWVLLARLFVPTGWEIILCSRSALRAEVALLLNGRPVSGALYRDADI
jgi:hypothetical protein